MRPPRFGPAIGWLQKLFAEAPRQVQTKLNFALIGGLSVAAWGAVRATQDIDFLMDSEPSPIGNLALRKNLEIFFNHQDCRVEWRVGGFAIGSNGSLVRSPSFPHALSGNPG
jgi:hypothetical protein